MDARLLARARGAGVTVIEDAALSSLVVEGGRVRGVRLHAGEGGTLEFRARVTLDATGRHRALVRRAERETGREVDVRRDGRESLVAFKAHLEGARGAAGVCEIYFYPGGYGGLSPVEKGLSNLCFITPRATAAARKRPGARCCAKS